MTTWPLLFPLLIAVVPAFALPLSLAAAAATSELRRFSDDEGDLRMDSRTSEGSEPASSKYGTCSFHSKKENGFIDTLVPQVAWTGLAAAKGHATNTKSIFAGNCTTVSSTSSIPDRIRVSERSRAAMEATADEGDTFRLDCFDAEDDPGCFVGAEAADAAAAADAAVAAGLSSISLVHLRLL